MVKGYSGAFRLGEATSTWDADSPVRILASLQHLTEHASIQGIVQTDLLLNCMTHEEVNTECQLIRCTTNYPTVGLFNVAQKLKFGNYLSWKTLDFLIN